MSVKKIIEEKCASCQPCACKKWQGGGNSGGGVYCFGLIGAAFYFFPHITNFSDFLWALGKSIVWPAMLVFQALTLLKL